MKQMMAGRVWRRASVALYKSHQLKCLSNSTPFSYYRNLLHTRSFGDFMCKVLYQEPALRRVYNIARFPLLGHLYIHSASFVDTAEKVVEPVTYSGKSATLDSDGATKVKRKKLKGKRAVVRWLKFFRWKKRKEYERMTVEETILFKLRKARKKEERLVESLKKLEPAESSETTHDPEILTPEEHFFFLKMGLKCKNYVPVGRRGIYQGVILNMHLHWKKHQTLKVVVKTFSPDEVKEIAAELARLSGGIVLDIHEENTIIMYRGKNYSQPPTEIMSPRVTLSRKKALDKSKYRDALRAVKKYIPSLEQELELLRAQAESKAETRSNGIEDVQNSQIDNMDSGDISSIQAGCSDRLKEIINENKEYSDGDSLTDLDMETDSENLSDIFETDSGTEIEEKVERPLYIEQFEKFPVENDKKTEDFDDHLRQISANSRRTKLSGEDMDSSPNFDEVDRMFLRAASLLRKKRR